MLTPNGMSADPFNKGSLSYIVLFLDNTLTFILNRSRNKRNIFPFAGFAYMIYIPNNLSHGLLESSNKQKYGSAISSTPASMKYITRREY